MKQAIYLLAPLLVAACSTPQPRTAVALQEVSLFVGLNMAELPEQDRRVITEASEDFSAVLHGHKPIHAVLDSDHPLPADGGTSFYNGHGYKLTILKSLSSFGQFNGVVYGPILLFERQFARGNTSSIASVRVYTNDQLRQLMSE